MVGGEGWSGGWRVGGASRATAPARPELVNQQWAALRTRQPRHGIGAPSSPRVLDLPPRAAPRRVPPRESEAVGGVEEGAARDEADARRLWLVLTHRRAAAAAWGAGV